MAGIRELLPHAGEQGPLGPRGHSDSKEDT